MKTTQVTSTPFISRSSSCRTSWILHHTSPRIDVSDGLHQPWQPQSLLFPHQSTWWAPRKPPPSAPPTRIVSGLGLGTCLDPWTLTSTVQTGLINPCTLICGSQSPHRKVTRDGRWEGTERLGGYLDRLPGGAHNCT